MSIRPPAVAGTFYPSEPGRLHRLIESSFADAVTDAGNSGATPKALVVPHAGYVYSGSVAAAAYRLIEQARSVIERVVLLGPSHRHWIRAMALPTAEAFETPFGAVPIDRDGFTAARALPGVAVDDRAHDNEHSLEVQLPFLQIVLDGFSLVPISVGDVSGSEVAAVLDDLWGGPETLIVVSTDLSHFHPYDVAGRLDRETAASIVAIRPGEIDDDDACGARPLRGLLQAAGSRGLGVEQLDLRSSGDTAGDRRRVVGYGAFAVA